MGSPARRARLDNWCKSRADNCRTCTRSRRHYPRCRPRSYLRRPRSCLRCQPRHFLPNHRRLVPRWRRARPPRRACLRCRMRPRKTPRTSSARRLCSELLRCLLFRRPLRCRSTLAERSTRGRSRQQLPRRKRVVRAYLSSLFPLRCRLSSGPARKLERRVTAGSALLQTDPSPIQGYGATLPLNLGLWGESAT